MLLEFVWNSTIVFIVRLRAASAFLICNDSEHNSEKNGSCIPTFFFFLFPDFLIFSVFPSPPVGAILLGWVYKSIIVSGTNCDNENKHDIKTGPELQAAVFQFLFVCDMQTKCWSFPYCQWNLERNSVWELIQLLKCRSKNEFKTSKDNQQACMGLHIWHKNYGNPASPWNVR